MKERKWKNGHWWFEYPPNPLTGEIDLRTNNRKWFMKNFQITDKETGEKYWISRSVAVAMFAFRSDPNEMFSEDYQVLAVKRGKGCPNEVGKWCCPCGYLDWGENLYDAVKREIFEETGYTYKNRWEPALFKVCHSRDINDQNISFEFCDFNCFNEDETYIPQIENRGGEENEVDEIKWIYVSDVKDYEWAFNHKNIIETALKAMKQRVGISESFILNQ